MGIVAALAALAVSLASGPAGAATSMAEPVAIALLELAKVRPEDRVVAVGLHDGSALAAAATRAGVRAAPSVQGAREPDLASATVVVLHLDPVDALRLRPLLLVGSPGARVVSLDADLGDWKPDRRIAVDVPAGKGAPARKASAYLWTVPANLNGDWCGQDAAKGAVLRIGQRLQFVEGAFLKATKALRFEGRIDGTRITAAAGRLSLAQSGDILRVTSAQGTYAAYRNTSFARTCCGTCP